MADSSFPIPLSSQLIVESLCLAALDRLHGTGLTSASVAVRSGGSLVGLVYASDQRARDLYELESCVGDGPSSAACVRFGPVLIEDLAMHPSPDWPVFAAESSCLGIASMCVLPLVSGQIAVGVLALCGGAPITLDDGVIAELLTLADRLLLALLAINADALGHQLGGADASAAVVHQAAGMIKVQLGVAIEDAVVALHAQAFGTSQSVMRVATAVVARQLRFASDSNVDDDDQKRLGRT